MSSRSIATSTLWQVASQFAMALLSTISVKFVAIALSRELAGSYNSAYGYLQLFAILADFGLYAVALRELSGAPASSSAPDTPDKAKVLGAFLTLRCAIMILALGSAVIIAWLVPAWRGTPLPSGVALAALVPFFVLLAGVLRTVFQVTYRLHLVFIAEVLHRVASTLLMSLPILYGIRQTQDVAVYQYFLAAGGIGGMVLLGLSLLFARGLMVIRPSFDPVLLKRLLRLALPYGVAYLCMALYRQFDVTMIALLRPDFQLQNAYYGFASRITEMSFLVPTFLLNSVLPVLGTRRAAGQDTGLLLGRTLFAVFAVGAMAMLFSWLWATPLMRLLTTEGYLGTPSHPGADTALALMSVPQLLNCLVLYSFYTLLALHEWKTLVRTMLLGVAVSVACNLLLIPAYGFVGAAITSIVVHGLLAATLLPQALKRLPVRLPPSLPYRYAACWLLAAVFLWSTAPFMIDAPMTIAAIVGVVVLAPAAVWATGLRDSFLAGTDDVRAQL